MERGFVLLVVALTVYVTLGVQGTAHLSYANNTQVNITQAGCGVTKLCVTVPDQCDPAGNTSCLFLSVIASTPVAPNGTDLSVELRGDSTGYVAMGLAANASEGTTELFICAQNSSDNGTFFFQTMQRNNTDDELTLTERRVTEIRGLVKNNVIQCEFNIPDVNATNTRSSLVTTFTILLGTGRTAGNTLGPFNISLSRSLNLADPASNIATTPAPNITMTTNSTTGSSGTVHPHAVLLLLSVLTLSVMTA